jgi:hypothetical protein
MAVLSRRQMLAAGGALALASRTGVAAAAAMVSVPPLMQKALRSFDMHRAAIENDDVIGVADFSQASRDLRFHIVDRRSGAAQSLLVAHGRGSDPDHSGWVERFSNDPGSAASSSGAYVTGDLYDGKHGLSRRLIGLDPENSNAEARGIVIHAANYVSSEIISTQGKLGRSEGCLAFSQTDITDVLQQLGPGRLIYVGKVA